MVQSQGLEEQIGSILAHWHAIASSTIWLLAGAHEQPERGPVPVLE